MLVAPPQTYLHKADVCIAGGNHDGSQSTKSVGKTICMLVAPPQTYLHKAFDLTGRNGPMPCPLTWSRLCLAFWWLCTDDSLSATFQFSWYQMIHFRLCMNFDF